MDISLVLSSRFADYQWTVSDNNYDGFSWLSDSRKPTEKELKALWPEVEYEHAYAQIEAIRQAEYQRTADPLFFEWQRGDATEQEWLDAVQAVKDAHPYPEAP